MSNYIQESRELYDNASLEDEPYYFDEHTGGFVLINQNHNTTASEIFEPNGFEVLEIRPYGKLEVSQELRNSFVEPFRSMNQECLEVTQAYF